ncbi:uncharacterized protein PSFLO_05771 [Pseudozyma flocculosa]|uniref:Uncharacterized protein n=1 Tax=Pseudozyma flocculosa TaxID=84751 RepID=A0A5C3FAH2_9BASI|nr:uncharacterized protein PSFLO_05771 [Pseudozyma flocculosa]
MSSRYSRSADELLALGPHVYDPSTMTEVDKECILFDCAEYVDQHWARSPFGAAARRDLAAGARQQDNWKARYELAKKHEKEEQAQLEARCLLLCYETPGDWVLYAPASVRLKYGTAPPAFHPDHGFLDLKQQLALKLSVLREEWWERASVALEEALVVCGIKKRSPLEAKIRALDAMASLEDSAGTSRRGPAPVDTSGIPGDDDATASEEAAAQAAPPLVAAETAEGAEPTELWGEGEAEEGPASAAPALDLLSSVVTAATGKRRADSTYPVPEGRAPAAKRLAPDVPRQKQRVVAGHSMNDLLAYAQSTPITVLLVELRIGSSFPWIRETKIFLSRLQLHVGRRWNELPRHRRERSVPCDNCVRLGIRCFDMVVGNPLLPSKKPIASCTGCYERRKGCVAAATLPSGCSSWAERDCWGERDLGELTGEQKTSAKRNHTAGAAALREADGHGPPVGFALDLLAAYCAQGRLEDAVNRLADGLPQGRLPVRLPERMAESMGARLWEEVEAQVGLGKEESAVAEPVAGPSEPRRQAAPVPADDDDDEDDLYLEE